MSVSQWNFAILIFLIMPALVILGLGVLGTRINTRDIRDSVRRIERVLERGIDAELESLRRQGLHSQARKLEEAKEVIHQKGDLP